MTRSKNTGRGIIENTPILSPKHFACCTSAALLAAFLQLPAFVCSCVQAPVPRPARNAGQIYIQWSNYPIPEALDLFFYDTLGARRLDSYQQILRPADDAPLYGLSGAGARYVVALTGVPGSLPAWPETGTYGNLCKLSYSLADENPDSPRLSGECLVPDGLSRLAELPLRTCLSAIRIQSLACDFSGRPYAGAPFFLQQLFLTYAGAECHPLGAGDGYPVSWINPGKLDSTAVQRLGCPEMVLQEGLGAIGPERVYPERTLYCYANPAQEATMGHPVTHLVLSGTVEGQLCYYPIPLPGLEPGCCYVLDITLRRMGTPDPDQPAVPGSYRLESRVRPWEEREPYTVTF